MTIVGVRATKTFAVGRARKGGDLGTPSSPHSHHGTQPRGVSASPVSLRVPVFLWGFGRESLLPWTPLQVSVLSHRLQ